MRRIKWFLRGLLNSIRDSRLDRETRDEISFHLESRIEHLTRQGVPPAAARRQARLEFGGVDKIVEEHRDARGLRAIDELRQDLRYAVRTLRNNRGFTAVAVLTLALGIGANTAIFTLVDALLLRWLPVRDPGRLVEIVRVVGTETSEHFSNPQIRSLAGHDEIFEGLTGFSGDTFNIGPLDAVEKVGGAWVTGTYYATLGLVPAAGRLLTPDDDQPGSAPAVVMTDGFWARRYGRDPAAIGRTLLVEGVPSTIVGVSPPGFSGAIVGEAAEISVSLNVLPQLRPERTDFLSVSARWLRILARPRADVPFDQVNARLAVVWADVLRTTVPARMPPAARTRLMSSTLQARSGAAGASGLRAQFRQPLLVLMGAVGLVLLIACANVANLVLARATSRQREIALRLAIGAGRARLVRQLLTEGALLSAAGAALGVIFAWRGSGLVIALISTGQREPTAADVIALDMTPNWHLFAFAAAIAAATTILFGLLPALRGTLVAPIAAMHAGWSRAAGPRGRLGSALVIAQVSISLLLLVGAGLFVRTLQNLRILDRGFRHDGVLLMDVDGTRRAGNRGARLIAFNQDILAAAEAVPGVAAASFSSITPLAGGGISQAIAVNGQPIGREETYFNNVGPRFFETMRTPVVLGREFTPRDDAASPAVAVVNEAFARRYLPTGSPLGQRVAVVGGSFGADMQVVGVVRDAVYETLRAAPPPTVYAPYLQRGAGRITLIVYATGSLSQVASVLRTAVQAHVPDTPLTVRTLTAQLESSLVQERLMAAVAGAFGGLALALAAVGLYGLLAYTVARRTIEIGIRVALGARRSQMIGLILNDAVRMLAVGAALGLPAAWAISRLIQSMLFGVTATDAVTIVGACGLLALVGVLAALLPARRAASIEPMIALRSE